MVIQLGFIDEHPVGIFHVLNPKTLKINLTCDVTSLHKFYSEWDRIEEPNFLEGLDGEDDGLVPDNNSITDSDSKEEVKENLFEQEIKEELKVITTTTFIQRW